MTVGRLDLSGKPAFDLGREVPPSCFFGGAEFRGRNRVMRRFHTAPGGGKLISKGRLRANYGHNLPRIVPFAKYSNEHPDWFSRKNGRFVFGPKKTPGVCMAHPQVRRLVLAELRRLIAHHRRIAASGEHPCPPAFKLNVTPADHAAPCYCPACGALTRREGSQAAPLIDFVNFLGQAIAEEFPEGVIETYAYEKSSKPPRTLRPRDNVVVLLATERMNIARPLSDPSNRKFLDVLKGWSRLGGNLGIFAYEYNVGRNAAYGGYRTAWNLPAPNIMLLGRRYRTYRDHGVRAIYQETMYGDVIQGDLWALKNWMSFKLMENPNLDEPKLLETFTDGFYGPAGAHVRQYLAALRDAERRKPSPILVTTQVNEYRYLDLAFLTKANAVFERARAAVRADSTLSRRVRHARIGVDRATLFRWPELVRQWVLRGNSHETVPLDRHAALRRFKQVYEEQIVRRKLPKDRLPHKRYAPSWGWGYREKQVRVTLAKVVAFFEKNVYVPAALPDKFAHASPADVYDYPVGDAMFRYSPGDAVSLVDDRDTTGAKAVRVRGEGLKLPVACGQGYEGRFPANVTIGPADVPGGGYRWYRIGTFWQSADTYVYVFSPPHSVRLFTRQNGKFDVWASIKFDGPAFKHSRGRKENAAWLARIVLVKPAAQRIHGSGSLPQEWTVFGPLKREDPVPPAPTFKTVPKQLEIGGRILSGRKVRATAGRYDLAGLFGPPELGRTAYVFVSFQADESGHMTLGLGADWWFQAWIDGQPLCDTMRNGNGPWPPSATDHRRTVRLSKGAHVLAVRFISGTGSSVLAVAGPNGLRELVREKP